jgi:ribosomal protein S18 acetylase RimI-like enzyme
MATETVILRPVTAADAAALAALVAQLYRAEEPRVLRGPPAGQLRLFTHMLEHELAGGARGRFLAVDELDRPLGSASVRLAGDPAPGALPAGLFAAAVRHVGPGDALRFFGYLLRSALTAETPLRRGECYIYSVVVDESQRRRGVGRAMIAQLEEQARRAGAATALLRVMAGNSGARELYLRLGYRTLARSSPLARLLGVPSELMRKELS